MGDRQVASKFNTNNEEEQMKYGKALFGVVCLIAVLAISATAAC